MICQSVLLMRRAVLSSQLLLRNFAVVLVSDMACLRWAMSDNPVAVVSTQSDASFLDLTVSSAK